MRPTKENNLHTRYYIFFDFDLLLHPDFVTSKSVQSDQLRPGRVLFHSGGHIKDTKLELFLGTSDQLFHLLYCYQFYLVCL